MRHAAVSRLPITLLGLALLLALGTVLPGIAVGGGVHHNEEGANPAPGDVDVTITALESGCPAGKTYCFDVTEIRARVGDSITITAVNDPGNALEHDVQIDEFDVHVHLHDPGDQDNVTFVADRAGTFTFYCSVPGHRQVGMEGSLIVEGDAPAGISTELLITIVAGIVAAIVVVILVVLWMRRRT